jgi:sigma-B regulation protein RsbU (phosphoserine phosphatase)
MGIYSVRIAYEPGIARPRLLLLLIVLAGVLLLLRLISARLYGWIDRHFFREAVNTERVLSELSEKVRTIVEAEPLLQTVTETISSALHVDRVAALIRRNDDFVPAYALGFGAGSPQVRFAAKSAVAARLGRDRQPLRAGSSIAEIAVGGEEGGALKILQAELVLPLAANDRLLGFLSLGPKRSEAPYSPSDVRLLEAVAVQTGLALENSRLTAEMALEIAHRERMARELEIARDVQQRLFPQEAPPVAGLDYAGKCRPAATIGGDYYDFLPVSGGHFGFAIGDVSGKGIPAALLMASLRASLRALAIAYSGAIAQLMADLNDLIYEASSADRYATFFYGVVDPAARTFSYVNAGHNPPLLFRAGSEDILHLEEGGLMVGTFRGVQYQQGSVALRTGDTLVMFTDGISEAMNPAGEEFGEDRIVAAIREGAGLRAAALVDWVLSAVDSFTAGAPQHDDMTLVVVRAL